MHVYSLRYQYSPPDYTGMLLPRKHTHYYIRSGAAMPRSQRPFFIVADGFRHLIA